MSTSRNPCEYRLKISDAYKPETLPMPRLVEYMQALLTMLGHGDHIHFLRVGKGSAVLIQRVDWEALPKVRERIESVKRQDAPAEAMKAYRTIDCLLADDNAKGCLTAPGGARVLRFPGAGVVRPPVYGSVPQPGTFTGELIKVGGEGDPVPVHLQDGGIVHICYATRAVARDLARNLFGPALRVSGQGRWRRGRDGEWHLDRFQISSFEPLADQALSDAVVTLREVPWRGNPDPVRAILSERQGKR